MSAYAGSSRPAHSRTRGGRGASIVGLIAALVLGTQAQAGAGEDGYGPQLRPNPYAGPPATATQHGDTGASDTTPYGGPGTGTVSVTPLVLGAACPTVLVGSDGYPVALCTRIPDLRPTIYLLDPRTGLPLAAKDLAAGSLLGGVYGYLDHRDHMVVVDGNSDLLRVEHRRGALGTWELRITESTHIELPDGHSVNSIAPDYDGNVWFTTGRGIVGLVGSDSSVRHIALPTGEVIANGIATAPPGVSVASTHALYVLTASPHGQPRIRWRAPYDRGSARKPGQLSWGTGSTPTFFGPRRGDDYLAIVDNADDQVNLLVYTARGGDLICSTPVLSSAGPGSENSPIGAGRTVVVAGTYGYPYPAYPDDAGQSEPESADFVGGITRVDVAPDESGCAVMWDSPVRSAAVPKLSTADGTITTVTRNRPDGAAGTTPLDIFSYTVLDVGDGAVLAERPMAVGAGFDTLQMAGNTTSAGVHYQGTITGILRITG